MLNQLMIVVVVALVVFGAVELIRKVLPAALRSYKPFACNVCMAFWSVLGLYLGDHFGIIEAFPNAYVAAATFGLAVILLRRFGNRTAPKLP